jgi:hypothetical protein
MKKHLFLASLLTFLAIPTAFAGTGGEMVTPTESALSADSSMCYDCGYYGGISFSVSSVVSTNANKIYVYGTYTTYEGSSKKEVVQDLAAAFADLKAATTGYGVLTRSSLYTYSDWQYTNMYDGTLSVRLELSNHSALEEVEELFYEKNFDVWTDVQVTNIGSVEKSAIADLREMIAEQKEIYEELLGYDLGRIAGLSLYTTVDSTTYNPDTNTVEATVWATVSYQAQD